MEFELDGVAELEVFGGALIRILIECRHHSRPVERDQVMLVAAKVRDTGSHECMLFTTSTFQRGAFEYAKAHGIATILFRDGMSSYFTRSTDGTSQKPPWAPQYDFTGWLVSLNEKGNDTHRLVADDDLEGLESWLNG